MTSIIKVQGLGEIVEVGGDFTQILDQLNYYGATLISPRDEAYARLQTRDAERIGRSQGTWTRAGFEYVKGELPVLVRESKLLDPELARQAVEANRQGRHFATNSLDQYAQSLAIAKEDESKDPKDRRAIILPSDTNFITSLERSPEVLQFLLQDQAEQYFRFNCEDPMNVYLVDRNTVPSKEGTTLTQLWFRYLGSRSGLNGNDRNLNCDDGSRGVRDGTSSDVTALSQKNLEDLIQNSITTGEPLTFKGKKYKITLMK